MQYLLSKDEYDALIKTIDLEKNRLKETLQSLCTKVCDHMPVHDDGVNDKLEPWGCIHTVESEWYCDDCPVQDDCPNEYKHWSK